MEKEHKTHKQKMDFSDVTNILITLGIARSFNAHWKSKEIVLKFDNRNDMTQFVNLLNTMYAAGEDILEEEKK